MFCKLGTREREAVDPDALLPTVETTQGDTEQVRLPCAGMITSNHKHWCNRQLVTRATRTVGSWIA